MKKVILISILLISGLAVNAQCDKELVKIAKSKLSENEVLINEFKVKLNKADINDPAPVAKFSQKLEEGKKYRLRTVSDKEEYNSSGILRLFESNRLLATNHEGSTDKVYELFTFICNSTGDYKLLVTFKDGKAGCAVVIVSEVK